MEVGKGVDVMVGAGVAVRVGRMGGVRVTVNVGVNWIGACGCGVRQPASNSVGNIHAASHAMRGNLSMDGLYTATQGSA